MSHSRRQFVGNVAGASVALPFLAARETVAKAETRETVAAVKRKRRVIFNDDGCSTTLYQPEPPMRPDQVTLAVDRLLGTHVDTLVWSVFTGNLVSHQTEVAEVMGSNMDRYGGPGFSIPFYLVSENVRHLIESGNDPLKLLVERAKEKNLEFWADVRMNDLHENSTVYGRHIRMRYKQAHPELLLGDGHWGWNYARPEVRQFRLNQVKELCSNYDLDGIHLDFCRRPIFFRRGEGERHLDAMTGLLRSCRESIRAIGRRRGRPFVFAVRVPPTLRGCRNRGLDVPRWIQEGFVDVLAIQSAHGTLTNMLVEEFQEVAAGRACQIYAGLERLDNENGAMTIEMFRAVALHYWQKRVDGLYVFNYDAHGDAALGGSWQAPFPPYERQILCEIGDPDLLRRRDKHYFISRRTRDDWTDTEVDPPQDLPVELEAAGQPAAFRVPIIDDLQAAQREGVLDDVALWVRLMAYDPKQDVVEFEWNGRRLPEELRRLDRGAKGEHYWVEFDLRERLPEPGDNRLKITLVSNSAARAGPVVVNDVELTINYEFLVGSRAYARDPGWYRKNLRNSAMFREVRDPVGREVADKTFTPANSSGTLTQEGSQAFFAMDVPEDCVRAQASGDLEEVTLWVHLANYLPHTDELAFVWNGTELPQTRRRLEREMYARTHWVEHSLRPFLPKLGTNELRLELKKRAPKLALPIEIDDVRLTVSYFKPEGYTPKITRF